MANGEDWRGLEAMYNRIDDQHKHCRQAGHSFDYEKKGKKYLYTGGLGRMMVLRTPCDKCGGIKEEFFYLNGSPFRLPKFFAPKGYYLKRTDKEREKNTRLSQRKCRSLEMRTAYKAGELDVYPFEE